MYCLHYLPAHFEYFECYSTNVVMNYTEIEAKVRMATNDEAWGPTGACETTDFLYKNLFKSV